MKTFQIIDGDLVMSGGRFFEITGAAACRQRIELSIRLDRESWFLNPDAGIDWWGIYDAKYVSDRLIRSEIERVLLADEEVTAIESLDISFDNDQRKITIKFKVSTIYGTISGAV
jgi:hypothetical protein